MRLWLGSVGTAIFSFLGLIFCLYFHIGGYLKSKSILERFDLVFKKLTQNKSSNPSFEDEESAKSDLTLDNPTSRKAKKWSFSFLGSKDEDDLLFGDVSLQKKEDETEIKTNPSKTSRKPTEKPKSTNTETISQPSTANSDALPEDSVSKNAEKYSAESSVEDKKDILDGNDNAPKQEVEMDGFKVVRAAKTEKAGDLFPERKGDYHFPTLDLLMEPPEEESNEDEDHMIKARNLKETLSEFKVEIELGEVHTGPVITRYDVHPAAGVRVEKIANLDKNLAMALKADSVRILAPVPGKGCVGIEVPNQKPAPVCLKEILQSKAWADAGAEIPIVLGKEASGKALVADLTKMPHLLVAGSTGSGKTVCINAIIASLCYHSSPEDVRFIMVDPKIVEMKVYNDLPHMLIPVVTEPKKVPGALKWLLVEMERRYQIFSKVGVRNIAGFNAKILKDKEEKEKAQLLDAEMTAEERAALSSIEVPRDDDVLEIPENKLPYIVCIIDELADLMMVAQADVETGIARRTTCKSCRDSSYNCDSASIRKCDNRRYKSKPAKSYIFPSCFIS